LRKNKKREISTQIEISSQSSARSKRDFAKSSQNFTESCENISLSKRTRNEISEIILQKLRNDHSKKFQNNRKSSHSIIFFSSNEIEMTSQHFDKMDQNMQEMIQTIIRDMMSKIIQQSIAAIVNVTEATATTRSNSFSA
jgi:hypothetical protein